MRWPVSSAYQLIDMIINEALRQVLTWNVLYINDRLAFDQRGACQHIRGVYACVSVWFLSLYLGLCERFPCGGNMLTIQ